MFRVQAVTTTLIETQSAAYIAGEAHVEQTVACEQLDQLVDVSALLQSDDEGTPMYSPDPLHTRMQTLRELLDEYGCQGLDELRDELQEQMDALEGRERDLVAYRLGLVEEAISHTD